MSLGDEGNRLSESEPRCRDCEDVTGRLQPYKGYEVVGEPEENPPGNLWYL